VIKSVIIVDDNPAMRSALCRLFKTAGGFEVCAEASNGLEAIAKIEELRPDLIVLDLFMPGLNGLETARELKNRKLPGHIILYSMNAPEIAEKEAAIAGVSAIVSKAEGIQTLITKARLVVNASVA
jgi:DNA-binding NarL/FixJ family response regulator